MLIFKGSWEAIFRVIIGIARGGVQGGGGQGSFEEVIAWGKLQGFCVILQIVPAVFG